MTIKRRLFISNILMLILPVFLFITVAVIMLITMMGLFGFKFSDFFKDGNHFNQAVVQIQAVSATWDGNDLDYVQIKTEVMNINNKHGGSNMAFAIYSQEEQLYTIGDFSNNPFFEKVMVEPGGSYYMVNNVIIYTEDVGTYKIVVMNTNYQIYNSFYNNGRSGSFLFFQTIMILLAVLIIITTNRILTRIIFKRIVGPLDALTHGVRQISEGNLDYRITYTERDEFAAVCNDFDEMARRLMEMVNSRIKDEENRKELIAGISHDLRTPLTSIKTYVEGIELGLARTPESKSRYLDTIKSKTGEMEHIVNQLFLFSKLDMGEFPLQAESINIGKWLFDFIMGVLEEYNQKGMKIEFAECMCDAKIKSDSVLLRNVMINIFENSLKYGNKEQVTMNVSCVADKSNIEIMLTDNGPGVTEESLEKLFTVFYREDKSRSNVSQGSGLGLAISAKIVERMGGVIKAANMPECGLSISISLPLAKGDK